MAAYFASSFVRPFPKAGVRLGLYCNWSIESGVLLTVLCRILSLSFRREGDQLDSVERKLYIDVDMGLFSVLCVAWLCHVFLELGIGGIGTEGRDCQSGKEWWRGGGRGDGIGLGEIQGEEIV